MNNVAHLHTHINIPTSSSQAAEKETALIRSAAVVESIHLPRPGKGQEVFAVLFNPSVGHITSVRRTERGYPSRVKELGMSGFAVIGTPARAVPNARYRWKAALTEMIRQSSVRRDRVVNEARPRHDINTYRILNGGDIDAVVKAANCDAEETKWLRGVLSDIGIVSSKQTRLDQCFAARPILCREEEDPAARRGGGGGGGRCHAVKMFNVHSEKVECK